MEDLVLKNGVRLRRGYTTGTCAALAAKAATLYLLQGQCPRRVALVTPVGKPVEATVLQPGTDGGAACCAVQKDAGDDPDVTHGMLVCARVEKAEGGFFLDGGAGVGRVTRKGLDQPVGAAAINTVPRRMIEKEVLATCRECGYSGGISVVISLPEGERLAAKTFNPHLGIEGGLSILGTSGIVEPMSTDAIVGTIEAELRMRWAEGAERLVLTPGNYGRDFVAADPTLARHSPVKCSNFIGEALDMAVALGYKSLLVVGHVGKLVKLAGGIMNTHSKTADCRLELLALHGALAGAGRERVQEVNDAATTDDGVELLQAAGLWPAVRESLLREIDRHLARRCGQACWAGAVVFSQKQGLLGRTPAAEKILKDWEESDG